MTAQARQIGFGVLALLGAAATWYFNIKFTMDSGGFSLSEFVRVCYANAASASISNDVLVVAAAFLFWSFSEARRLSMRGWWIYATLTFMIALAFTFPLFLLMRERAIAVTRDS